MPENSPEREPPAPLSEAYHKARRNLAIFSGILIAWEYVGINVGNKEAGVDAKLPGELIVEIGHPEVIPVVIVVMVLYFSLRLAVEWYQCDVHRRAQRASLVDVMAAYILASSSVLLFIVQQALQLQLAIFLTPLSSVSFLMGILFVFLFNTWPFRYIINLFLKLISHTIRKDTRKDARLRILICSVLAITVVPFADFIFPPLTTYIEDANSEGNVLTDSEGNVLTVQITTSYNFLTGVNVILYFVGVGLSGIVWFLIDKIIKIRTS